MTSKDLLSHFNLTQLPFPKEIPVEQLLELTHQASGGSMRDINAIAHGAMMNAYMSGSPQVEAEHVKAAIER